MKYGPASSPAPPPPGVPHWKPIVTRYQQPSPGRALWQAVKNDASVSACIRYFLFKIPLIVTQILPPTVIVSTLLSLGMLCRHNEIAAFRAGGVSLGQTALPLLALALLISMGALAWNELIVPYCTRRYQTINLVEIRKRERRSLLSDRGIWYHGRGGFYNIDHIDARKRALYGITVYRTDSSFGLTSVVHIETAQWNESGWKIESAVQHDVDADGRVVSHAVLPEDQPIVEKFEDFQEVQTEPEEMSYQALRARIEELTAKGIDASNYLVDLNLKLSIPFASFVLAAVAIPIAGRVRQHVSIAAIVAQGAALGFVYWVLLGLTTSLGQAAVLPAAVAAWSANFAFALISAALFLRSE